MGIEFYKNLGKSIKQNHIWKLIFSETLGIVPAPLTFGNPILGEPWELGIAPLIWETLKKPQFLQCFEPLSQTPCLGIAIFPWELLFPSPPDIWELAFSETLGIVPVFCNFGNWLKKKTWESV